jgi:hypothetical protein
MDALRRGRGKPMRRHDGPPQGDLEVKLLVSPLYGLWQEGKYF